MLDPREMAKEEFTGALTSVLDRMVKGRKVSASIPVLGDDALFDTLSETLDKYKFGEFESIPDLDEDVEKTYLLHGGESGATDKLLYLMRLPVGSLVWHIAPYRLAPEPGLPADWRRAPFVFSI